eukprot:1357181-Pleurochrysis_carterae.AAC.1
MMASAYDEAGFLSTLQVVTKWRGLCAVLWCAAKIRINLSWKVWETPVRCTATAVALRVAGRWHGACFEALYQR